MIEIRQTHLPIVYHPPHRGYELNSIERKIIDFCNSIFSCFLFEELTDGYDRTSHRDHSDTEPDF